MTDLAAIVAELAERLPPEHVAAWSQVLRPEPVVTAGTGARLVGARPGFAIGGAAAKLVGAWRAADPPLPGAAIALALESAARIASQAQAQRSQVVVSGPASDSEAVRLTNSVISELIHDSRESLLIVSFAAFGVSQVVHEPSLPFGVALESIWSWKQLPMTEAPCTASVGAAAAFEAIRQDVTIWNWPASRRPAVGNSRAALHAKLVAADQRIALLGSANLTDKALAYNLELGVIIRDPYVVRRMVRHFRSLMRPGSGPLERA